MKTILMALAGVAFGLGTAVVSAQSAARNEVSVAIESQPLRDALNVWAQQTGYQLISPTTDITSRFITPKVAGTLTAQDALEQLLSGTPLTFEWLNERVVAIRTAAREKDGAKPAASTVDDRNVVRVAQASAGSSSAGTQGAEGQQGAASSEEIPDGARLEEVVVTAQKRQERALDIPISITAIEGEELEDFRIRDMQDLSFFVPSLSVAEIGPGMGQIAIRGLGSERGNSSLTGVYLDEAALAVSGEFPVDLVPVDLERVEVLKGPQGTLYGEGSTGGTIRYITRAPDLNDFSARAELSVYDTDEGGLGEELTGVLNVPMVGDKLGMRIAGYFENASGWIDRPATSAEDINDSELIDVRTRVLWKPAEALEINGTVVVHRNDAGAQNVVNLDPRSDSNFLTQGDPAVPTDVRDDFDLYSLTATYDFGAASLLSATSYLDMDKLFRGQSQLAPIDFGPGVGVLPLGVLARNWTADIEVFSQELRLASNGDAQLQWTAGAFYRDSEVLQDRLSEFYPFGFASGGPELNASKSWAVFADAAYDLTERLRFGAGLRYFEDDRSRRQGNETLPFDEAPLLKATFDNLSSRVYASYELSSDARIYLSRSEGFRSGGLNDPNNPGAPLDFDPEILTAYELGTKLSLLDGRLAAEFALFYNEFTDIQYLGIAGGVALQAYFDNIGEAEMKGFDWSLRWRAADRLTFGFSGDKTDTEVTELAGAGTAQQIGDPIDFVADYTLTLSADFGFDWTAGVPGLWRAAYNQKGPARNTTRNIGLVDPQDESDTLRFLSVEVGAVFGGVTVGLFGQNLLDEDGKLRPGISQWWAQARPRTVGLRVSAEF
jgi:iron complex outermembrane recepter protein